MSLSPPGLILVEPELSVSLPGVEALALWGVNVWVERCPWWEQRPQG